MHILRFGEKTMPTIRGTSARNVINGTGVSESIYGLSGNDDLFGLGGNDFLNGGGGNDLMYGGDGNDRMYGGSDLDTMYGGNGNDTMDAGSGNDVMNGGDGNDYLYGSTGNDSLDGGNGNDILTGGSGNDTMTGGAGDDYINAGAGTDVIAGGTDTMVFNLATTGWVGGDTLSYADSSTGVTVSIGAGSGGLGGAAGDTWSGVEHLVGSEKADVLTASDTVGGIINGGGGDDRIVAGNWDEFMYGGAGSDTLVGKTGDADWFGGQYGQGLDRFEGFETALDWIAVSKAEFKLSGATAGTVLNASALEVGTSHLATASTTRFVFETDTHILWADLDGTGDSYGSVAVAVINDMDTLSNVHFMVLA